MEKLKFQTIKYDIEQGQVGILTMNRPEALNALNILTFHELNQLFDELEKERQLTALVITGAGRAFAAGADLKECVDAGIEENRNYAELAQHTFNRLENLPFPVVAAVNGFALGEDANYALPVIFGLREKRQCLACRK